jgi:hypothetical protein
MECEQHVLLPEPADPAAGGLWRCHSLCFHKSLALLDTRIGLILLYTS